MPRHLQLALACFMVFPLQSAAQSALGLRNLGPVTLEIQLDPEIPRWRLTAEAQRAQLEARLLGAGIQLKEASLGRYPLLLATSVFRQGEADAGLSFHISLSVLDIVKLTRIDTVLVAQLFEASTLGASIDIDGLPRLIRDRLDFLIDEFLAAYRRQNPRF